MGPLLPSKSQRSAKRTLLYIVLYSRGGRHASSVAETELSEKTVIKLRQWLDSLMATAHIRRRVRLRSKVTTMQCDETFFSARKRGGCHRAKRVRQDGNQIAQSIAVTTRDNKLSEILMESVPNRTSQSLLPNIQNLASGSRTKIWTHGARHNLSLRGKYKWESVNHKGQWVTNEGVHTNTVECANSMVKKRLKRDGNVLGRKLEKRGDRIQAYAEVCTGSLKCNGGDTLLQVLRNLKEHCVCLHL